MNFAPSETQLGLKDYFSKFAKAHLNAGIPQRVKEGRFERELWTKCGEEGVQGLCIPQEYGGRGLGSLDMVFALEGLGYGCEDAGLLFAMAAQLLACNIPIWLHGSDEQKRELLPRLCKGDLIISNAMTEADGGSAAFQMSSTAVPGEAGFRLSGLKTYCANAPVSDLCLAYVLTDPEKGFFGGVSAFLLDRKRHEYVVVDELEKIGLRTCLTGQVSLDGILASSGDILGEKGGGAVLFNQSMDWERIGMSALNIGAMSKLLEGAVEFSKKRKPGGVPISKHQAISHNLADIQADLEACKLLVYQAAWGLDQNQKVSRDASICKLFVSERFISMCVNLCQIYASEGYQADSEIGRRLHESIASSIYSGTSNIQRNIITRWMGL